MVMKLQLRRRAWIAYPVIGTIALFAFLFVPGMRAGPLFNVIGLSSPLVIVIAARLHAPRQRLPWYLVAVGQTLFIVGDIITYNYERFFGVEQAPFPSIGDALYLSVYPFLVAGILLLIRRRSPGRDRASLIDSLIVSVGVGALSWVFLIAPYVHDPSLTLVQKLAAIGYPLMDLLLFSVAVRLAVGAGRRPVAFYLMLASVAVLFVTDTIYGWILLNVPAGYNNSTGLLEGGWGLFYILWGAAALHPSMQELDEPAPDKESKQPRRRLLVLASASLMAPAVQLFLSIRGKQFDVAVLAGCSAILFVLVLVRLNGLMVDITAYRRTERQLRETEAKYRTLVEGMPAVVYIAEFGEDGAWKYISPQIERVIGFTQEEFVNVAELWRERIVPEDREKALEAEQRVLRGQGRLQCEYRVIGRDGELIWIREEADALHGENGEPLFLQGVMYDVTEQKESEDRLRQALDTEVEASNRLRAVHEMQNSFLQAVSHDLRTPLTSIVGSALTLERDEGDLDAGIAKDLIRSVAANARKLHRLLTNLLDLDRMSRGILEPNRNLVDLTRIARGVMEETAADAERVKLVTTDPVMATVDAAQVERIIENLVTNAMRYTPADTLIWIRLEEEENGILIVVEDSGPGVSPELHDTIFQPFQQGDEVVSHSPGVGIGLSLVARFAQLHGGRAWVEDREGGGASFRVYLPDSPPRRASEGEPADAAPGLPGPGGDDIPSPLHRAEASYLRPCPSCGG
jgi:PAS domain S-box-containing protein